VLILLIYICHQHHHHLRFYCLLFPRLAWLRRLGKNCYLSPLREGNVAEHNQSWLNDNEYLSSCHFDLNWRKCFMVECTSCRQQTHCAPFRARGISRVTWRVIYYEAQHHYNICIYRHANTHAHTNIVTMTYFIYSN